MITINERVTESILNSSIDFLNDEQLRRLKEVLYMILDPLIITENKECTELACTDMRNEQILKTFLCTKKLEGKSDNTLKLYSYYIKKMLDYLNKYIGNINVRDLRKFMVEYQRVHNITAVTLRNIQRSLSSFFNWLEDEDYIQKSPMKKIKTVKVNRVIKKPFTDEEIIKIKNAALKTRNAKRDIALVEFLNSTGCRVSECASINVQDIDFVNKTVIVFGKGGKERTAYITDSAYYYMMNYLTDENGNIRRFGYLFLSRSGKKLQKDDIERTMRIIGQMARVDNVHPHRFRRTLACRLINRGVPVQEVMVILGHSNIETTMIYCNISEDNVKLSHKRYA